MSPVLRSRQQATVLVVDDDPSTVRVLRAWLQRAGFARVLTSTDPTAVERLLEVEAPDVLLLDLAMPGLDGFSLLQTLAPALAGDRPLRVVMVTGHDHPSIAARALALGVAGILAKTASYEELVAALDGALAG